MKAGASIQMMNSRQCPIHKGNWPYRANQRIIQDLHHWRYDPSNCPPLSTLHQAKNRNLREKQDLSWRLPTVGRQPTHRNDCFGEVKRSSHLTLFFFLYPELGLGVGAFCFWGWVLVLFVFLVSFCIDITVIPLLYSIFVVESNFGSRVV